MGVTGGCDVVPLFQNGWTPLIAAAYWGRLEAVQVLLKHKVMADFDNKVSECRVLTCTHTYRHTHRSMYASGVAPSFQ